MLTYCVLLSVPAATITWILSILQDSGTLLCLLILMVTYLLSIWCHELAHAASYAWLSQNSDTPPPQAQGSWRRARISRKSMGILADAAISITGPLAGMLCLTVPLSVSSLTIKGNYLFLYPWLFLFLTHLWALLPWHADGAQIFTYLLKRKIIDANY